MPLPLTFGNVPHPPFVDRLIPDAQNMAWDDLGPRRPVGVCQHSMAGSLWGTDRWFRRGSASDGLTDYGIGNASDGARWDGVILRWNDPLGRAANAGAGAVGANRSGWANGGSDGLEGDGPLFVRTLGVAAINRDLVSIERSDGGDTGQPMSPRQLAAICLLTAHWFDVARVPWSDFPLNPAATCVTHLLHKEFATKDCPHPSVYARIDELQNRVRQILRAAQTSQPAGAPVPPPRQTAPNHGWWPKGYDAPTLAARFGALSRHTPDGRIERFPFDPTGVISNAWVARGAAEARAAARLPRALDWWTLTGADGSARDLVTFADRWTLHRSDTAAAWTWMA